MKKLLFLLVVILSLSKDLFAALAVSNGPGASNVTATTATIPLRITATNAPPLLHTNLFTWGTADGATNLSAWANVWTNLTLFGLAQTNVTGLTPATRYYYRAAARDTNGLAWAAQSQSFLTALGGTVLTNYPYGTTNFMVVVDTGLNTVAVWMNGSLLGSGGGSGLTTGNVQGIVTAYGYTTLGIASNSFLTLTAAGSLSNYLVSLTGSSGLTTGQVQGIIGSYDFTTLGTASNSFLTLNLAGAMSNYFRTLIPTNNNQLANGAGYVTGTPWTGQGYITGITLTPSSDSAGTPSGSGASWSIGTNPPPVNADALQFQTVTFSTNLVPALSAADFIVSGSGWCVGECYPFTPCGCTIGNFDGTSFYGCDWGDCECAQYAAYSSPTVWGVVADLNSITTPGTNDDVWLSTDSNLNFTYYVFDGAQWNLTANPSSGSSSACDLVAQSGCDTGYGALGMLYGQDQTGVLYRDQYTSYANWYSSLSSLCSGVFNGNFSGFYNWNGKTYHIQGDQFGTVLVADGVFPFYFDKEGGNLSAGGSPLVATNSFLFLTIDGGTNTTLRFYDAASQTTKTVTP